MAKTTRIGLATTGGDAPGMNACIRAVAKGADSTTEIIGIRSGALGLLRGSESLGDYFQLRKPHVSNIINRSGTVLKSTRTARFRDFVLESVDLADHEPDDDLTRDERFSEAIGNLAASALEKNRIDALILIGGDTTCRAAQAIYSACNRQVPIIVIPATIDNDIAGTVQTIGFDSAISMASAQVDAIRETAASMDRIFIVEVMGHKQGHIAVEVALATGAENVMVPEQQHSPASVTELAARLVRRAEQDRESAIVIVAEGTHVPALNSPAETPSQELGRYILRMSSNVEVRTSVLGHILRGAPPTAFTRNLATRSGLRALEVISSQLNRGGGSEYPSLIGVHRDGFIERVPVVGSMVRAEASALLKTADDVNRRLSF